MNDTDTAAESATFNGHVSPFELVVTVRPFLPRWSPDNVHPSNFAGFDLEVERRATGFWLWPDPGEE